MFKDMIDAGAASMAELRSKMTHVRYGRAEHNEIRFNFDDVPYVGVLRGRNAHLMLGFNSTLNAAIALRVMLDGDARHDR